MNANELYGQVLNFVLVGLLIGAAFVGLGAFMSADGVSASAVTAINNTINAIAALPSTWFPIFVVFIGIAVMMGYILRGFLQRGR